MLLLLQALGDVCSDCRAGRVKLKGTGDSGAFQDEAARQAQSSFNLYLSLVVFFVVAFVYG